MSFASTAFDPNAFSPDAFQFAAPTGVEESFSDQSFSKDGFSEFAFSFGLSIEDVAPARTGGISNRKKNTRPPYWWEERKPKEIELPYRPPERAAEPIPFHATPDISEELAELDERIYAERRAKRHKRRKRVAMLALMVDE